MLFQITSHSHLTHIGDLDHWRSHTQNPNSPGQATPTSLYPRSLIAFGDDGFAEVLKEVWGDLDMLGLPERGDLGVTRGDRELGRGGLRAEREGGEEKGFSYDCEDDSESSTSSSVRSLTLRLCSEMEAVEELAMLWMTMRDLRLVSWG